MRTGVVYVAIGAAARSAAAGSIASLRRHGRFEVVVYGDGPVEGADGVCAVSDFVGAMEPRWMARLVKISLDTLTPFHSTLYLDADTLVNADPSPVFAVLADGWDWCMAPSTRQAEDAFGNCQEAERLAARAAAIDPLALQCGAFAWRQGPAASELFAAWRACWRGREDQAAFRLALDRAPVRLWTLGWPWHAPDGEVVKHRFGALTRHRRS